MIGIEKNLQNIENTGQVLFEQLHFLDHAIRYMFSQIKLCETIESAQDYFAQLDEIQSCLAILVHKYDIGISNRLWRFMSDFDNFQEAKEYYFPKIKSGEYSFETSD